MKTWSLKNVSIKDLKKNPKNPRHLSKEQALQLETSLSKFGLADKPIVNTDLMIIGGHQRIATLKKMGQKKIDCWVPDETLSESEVDELNIRLNKNHGTFDYEILANEFNVPDLVEWGFTIDDLEINMHGLDDEEKPKEDQPKAVKMSLCPHCGKEIG